MKIKITLCTLLAIILLFTLPLIPAVQYDAITQEQKKHTYNNLQKHVIEKLKQGIKNKKEKIVSSNDNLESPTRLIQPFKCIYRILVKILLFPLKLTLRLIIKLIFFPLKLMLLPLKILFLPVTLFFFPIKLMIKTFIFILKIITFPPRILANIISLLIPSRDPCKY
jgi:hypothetical protein